MLRGVLRGSSLVKNKRQIYEKVVSNSSNKGGELLKAVQGRHVVDGLRTGGNGLYFQPDGLPISREQCAYYKLCQPRDGTSSLYCLPQVKPFP